MCSARWCMVGREVGSWLAARCSNSKGRARDVRSSTGSDGVSCRAFNQREPQSMKPRLTSAGRGSFDN